MVEALDGSVGIGGGGNCWVTRFGAVVVVTGYSFLVVTVAAAGAVAGVDGTQL